MRRCGLRGRCGLAWVWAVGLCWSAPLAALAQNDPHLGYAYPAGGQAGTEFRMTLGGQYFISKSTRVTLNYEWREAEVSNPPALTNPVQRSNARIVADNLGDRASLQLTWYF